MYAAAEIEFTIDRNGYTPKWPCQPVRVTVDHFRAHFGNFASLLRGWLCCRTVRFQTLQFVFKFFYSSLEFLYEFWRFHGAVCSVWHSLHVINNLLPEAACGVPAGAGLTAPRYWAPQLVWTHRPIGLTAPSKLDLQPRLGFAPLDLQPHPESATFSRHSSSQRNQIGPYHTNYLLRDYSLCCVIIVIYLGLAEMRGTWSHTYYMISIISWKLREFATSYNFVLC